MQARQTILALAACSTFASGCQFYFGGDDDGQDDSPCAFAEDSAGAPLQLRNPYTGECVYGGGGGGGCWGDPQPAEQPTGADIWFDFNWPVCDSFCNQLGEGDCLEADGCRAIYVDLCPPNAECAPNVQFSTCWAVASDGPVRGGDCTQLTDALECARHDDCSALHERKLCGPDEYCESPAGSFTACQNEGGAPPPVACYSDMECAPEEHCNTIDFCLPPPGCMPDQGCPPVCYGKCVPDETLPPPPPPPPPPASCTNLDEATCIDMADGCIDANGQSSCGMVKCEPIYEGSGCSCDANGCTCQAWTYELCRNAS